MSGPVTYGQLWAVQAATLAAVFAIYMGLISPRIDRIEVTIDGMRADIVQLKLGQQRMQFQLGLILEKLEIVPPPPPTAPSS